MGVVVVVVDEVVADEVADEGADEDVVVEDWVEVVVVDKDVVDDDVVVVGSATAGTIKNPDVISAEIGTEMAARSKCLLMSRS